MNEQGRPGDSLAEPGASLSLWDWRRRVAELYATVRMLPPEEGWNRWITERRNLFRNHPQSPVAPASRGDHDLRVHPYSPDWRVTGRVVTTEPGRIGLPHSGDGTTAAHAFGRVEFSLAGQSLHLTAYWLDEYGGGVFIPFRDATNGDTSYGGGRYLIDTAKGADLGHEDDRVVLDFNFAYHPSCVHDSRWSCPLSPPGNTLPVRVDAGERLP